MESNTSYNEYTQWEKLKNKKLKTVWLRWTMYNIEKYEFLEHLLAFMFK